MGQLNKISLTLLINIYNFILSFWYFSFPNCIKIITKKIEFPGRIPICRQLIRVSGIGKVIVGDNCRFGYKNGGFHRGGMIEFQARYKNAKINIGKNVSTNNNICICSANSISIGDETLIGQYVTITDFEGHGIHPTKRKDIGEIGRIVIGKNVWIGSNVMILKNTFIGDNTIVAAGAIVCGNYPENVIIGGVPAKIIKKIDV